MAAQLKASFVLALEDQLSGGLAKLNKALSALGDLGRRLTLDPLARSAQAIPGATSAVNALNRAIDATGVAAGRAEAAMGRLWSRVKAGAGTAMGGLRSAGERIGVVGAAVGGIGMAGALHSYAEYENILRHTAITEGKSGTGVDAEILRLDAMFKRDAKMSGQSSHVIAEAYMDLIQWGMAADLAEKLLPIHSRAATAYNIDPKALGPAVFALGKTMGIDEKSMPQVLAGMALATKEGRFKMADMATYLPGEAGVGAPLGLTGASGAATLFALNEVVAQRTTSPDQAGQYVAAFLGHINEKSMTHNFAKASGIDLDASIARRMKLGMNQFDAFMDVVKVATKGLTGRAYTSKLGALIGNQEDLRVVQSVLDLDKEFNERRARYAHVDPGQMNADFTSGFGAVKISLNVFDEQLTQLSRRFAVGLLPGLREVNSGLTWFNHLLGDLDRRMPGLTGGVASGLAAFVAIMAVIGAIGFVAPAVGAGFDLLATALGALVSLPVLAALSLGALIGILGYGLYGHWDETKKIVGDYWTGISNSFSEQSKLASDQAHADLAWLGSLLPAWLRDLLGLPNAPVAALAGAPGADPANPYTVGSAATGRIDIRLLWDENTGRMLGPVVKTDAPNFNISVDRADAAPEPDLGRSIDRDAGRD